MDNRYALVTGGSGGIGREVCRLLAERGIRPIVGYAHSNYNEDMAREVNGIPLRIDLSDIETIERSLHPIENILPSIDCVILAASPSPKLKQIGQVLPEELDFFWRCNVLGNHILLRHILTKSFKPKRRGSIVGILSASIKEDQSCASLFGAYAISKYALKGLLSLFQADYPWLRIHMVSPSLVQTSMLQAFDPRILETLSAKAPIDTPENIAKIIVKAAYPDAS